MIMWPIFITFLNSDNCLIYLFSGFAVAVKSIFSIAQELSITSHYKYLLTYKFSQDHIEIFFSKIFHVFGNNNNPNVLEFKTAKKIITKKFSVIICN